ncbi:MAG: hypothetical protein QM820_03575 [Minicystis sp.]
MNLSRASLSAALLLSSSLLGGCVAGADTAVEPGEDVAEAESAFAESTCATASANVTDGTIWNQSSVGANYSTLNGNYGQSSCTHAFIVDYTNGTSYNVPIWAGFHDQPTTQFACSLAHVRVKTYEKLSNGTYVPYEEMRLHGAWRGGECWFDPDTGYGVISLSTLPTRVTAQAYSTFCTLNGCSTTYEPIKVSASAAP